LRDQICYRPGMVPLRQSGDCDTREPEDCPTYEQWLNSFRRLTTFSARDTAPGGVATSDFDVIGRPATRPVDDPNAPTEEQPAPAIRPHVSDRFIDHPTDRWVTTCLPSNLRETAYLLPSDCADIAVILRHVWLSAHHRTERYGAWIVGDQAGSAQRQRMGRIIGEVYTGNVARMVNAYSDQSGRPLRTFAALQGLLHPGDILVWEHHDAGLGTPRTGGHTQTIVDIMRDGSTITRINAVQGNQPIFQEQAREIRRHIGRGALPEDVLRDAPGRRIETGSLSAGSTDTLNDSDFRDLELPSRRGRTSSPRPRVWTWSDGHTTLVAAGPPAAASRPAIRRIQGQTIRRISDWFSSLRSAARDRLHGILEAALLETRAMIEGGQTGLDTDATTLGQTAGERLWNLARQAGQSRTGDLSEETHFRPLQRMRATIQALGNPEAQPQFSSVPGQATTTVRRIFALIDAAFHLAARGASTISFTRRVPRNTTLVRVLVTGFDPFVSSGSVPAGEINPSGAAALAMDNTEVNQNSITAAVEGIVLPVRFADFRTGMVENIVRPLVQNRGVDSVITVSLDAALAPADPVRIERYVVGVHEEAGVLGPISSTSSAGIGPAIIETPSPVEDIARETAQPGRRGSPEIPRPQIGTAVQFRFSTSQTADQAMRSLGLLPSGRSTVSIDNVPALRQIIRTMQRSGNGVDITFRAGGRSFEATVLSGPGGDFLSNEVSFRMLRLLGEEQRLNIPSFHVHVQRPLPQIGERIPQDTSTPAARTSRQRAISFAIDARNKLITTLRRMIQAVAIRVAARLNFRSSQTP